jgi:hypothetical protein
MSLLKKMSTTMATTKKRFGKTNKTLRVVAWSLGRVAASASSESLRSGQLQLGVFELRARSLVVDKGWEQGGGVDAGSD